MIDVVLDFRGQLTEPTPLSSVPPVGTYLEHDAGLFVTTAIVLRGTTFHVYCAPVGPERRAEILAEWASWQDAPAPAEAADRQGGFFSE
jgi:hypothetical protein